MYCPITPLGLNGVLLGESTQNYCSTMEHLTKAQTQATYVIMSNPHVTTAWGPVLGAHYREFNIRVY